ncbi:MAG TPA: ComF family protein [Thermoanaerobaculia bacterium]
MNAREPSGILVRVAGAAASLLYPSPCVACENGSVERIFQGGVCDVCWSRLPPLAPQRCETCDLPLPAAEALRCGRCILDPPPFATLRGAVPYRGVARQILLAFKFRGADYLAPRLARRMIERIPAPGSVAEITAVPATRRSRWRQDHAAEVLAMAVARELGLPFVRRRLEKVRSTRKQSRLPFPDRAGNVKGAFRARGSSASHTLLIDDVATSGATARECAAALLRAGAKRVDVWCFARASRDDAIADWQPDFAGADR